MRILHPRPAEGRQTFIGVEFRNGAAELESLHPEVRASLVLHGFTIQDAPKATVPTPKATTPARKAPAPLPPVVPLAEAPLSVEEVAEVREIGETLPLALDDDEADEGD